MWSGGCGDFGDFHYKRHLSMGASINKHTCLVVVTFVVMSMYAQDSYAQESSGLMMRRIEGNQTLAYYYKKMGESGKTLISRLDSLSNELGMIPTRSQTIGVLVESGIELSQEDWLWFETILRKIQRPSLSNQNVFEMYQAYSQNVPPLNCTYHVTIKAISEGGGAGDERLNYQFSRDAGNVTFLSMVDGFTDENTVKETWIFNGVEMREVAEVHKGLSNEFVTIPANLRPLYPEYHPFHAARISPEESVRNPDVLQDSGFAAFEDAGAVVFETPETVDDHQCVVVGFLDWAILLDPSLNYAIVEERFGDLAFRGKYVRKGLHHRMRNSDFVDLDGRCFLPRRSHLQLWRDERPYKDIETVIDSMEIRPEKSLAETFIRPDYLHVSNAITGDNTLSTAALPTNTLDKSTTSGQSMKTSFVVAFNCVLLLAFAYLAWRRRKRSAPKQAT
jgi:hypothetical protein